MDSQVFKPIFCDLPNSSGELVPHIIHLDYQYYLPSKTPEGQVIIQEEYWFPIFNFLLDRIRYYYSHTIFDFRYILTARMISVKRKLRSHITERISQLNPSNNMISILYFLHQNLDLIQHLRQIFLFILGFLFEQ